MTIPPKLRRKGNQGNLIIICIFLFIFSSFAFASQPENPLKNKIHADLWNEIEALDVESSQAVPKGIGIAAVLGEEKSVDVLIKAGQSEDLAAIGVSVTGQGGALKGVYQIGNVISAKVPVRRLTALAQRSEVNGIWPNQKYQPLLKESVPQINVPVMWNLGVNGSGVKIAIIDTGIDAAHADFSGRIIAQNDFVPASYVVSGVEYGDGDNDGIAEDNHGHGTHVAGIAAGSGPLYRGVAPAASLLIAKVFGTKEGFDDWIIAAINWAVDPDGNPETDDGADIISMSLGSKKNENGPLNAAVRDAIARNVTVIIASGNDGYNTPSTPGNVEEAITVGAVDKQNVWAYFSSGYDYGTYLKPDVVAPGVGIVAPLATDSLIARQYPQLIVDGSYIGIQGTSMATPHVSGAAALLLQSRPELSPSDVKYILEKTATPAGDTGKDILYGSGIIDASKFLPSLIDTLLRYRINVTKEINVGEPVAMYVSVTAPKLVENITATLVRPDGRVDSFSLLNTSDVVWEAAYADTSALGIYLLNFLITERQGETVMLSEEFSVVSYGNSQGSIRAINAPASVEYDTTFPVSITVENNGATPLTSHAEVQLRKDNQTLLDSFESESRVLSAGEEHTFTINATARALPGDYILRTIVLFDTTAQTQDSNLIIQETNPPVISTVSYPEKIFQNNPFIAEIIVDDFNSVAGFINITLPAGNSVIAPLNVYVQSTGQKMLAATYADTYNQGAYSFYILVCDDTNLCSVTEPDSFIVESCQKPSIVVIEESATENSSQKYRNVLEQNYCLSVWPYEKSGLPPLSYLTRFNGVIWSSGNYWSKNIDEQSAALLGQYYAQGGRLVVEGSDIASTHRYDTFMTDILHSAFIGEFDLSNETTNETSNETFISLWPQLPHIIFKNITDAPNTTNMITPLRYTPSKAKYPDAVEPVNGGVALARWPNGNSAAVSFQNSRSQILFFPLSLDAIANNAQLISNIADWLGISPNAPDVYVKQIIGGNLTGGSNTISAVVENQGTQDVSGYEISLIVDGQKHDVQSRDIAGGQEALITFLPVNLSAATHEITILLNENLNTIESNYLNNRWTENRFAVPAGVDIAIEDISVNSSRQYLEIVASIANNGGSDTAGIDVEILINSTVIAREIISLNRLSFGVVHGTSQLSSGVYQLTVRANPLKTVPEADYQNNEYSILLNHCAAQKILVVDDNDAGYFMTENPSSISRISKALPDADDSVCVTLWNQSNQTNHSEYNLSSYDIVVWSSGQYYGRVIDEQDAVLLESYEGNILFEGADIGYDHQNDTLMQTKLHATLESDFALRDTTAIEIEPHPVFEGITDIPLDYLTLAYPDSFYSVDGFSLAQWTDKESAIAGYNGSNKVLYFGFSVNSIANESIAVRLINNSIAWLNPHPPQDETPQKINSPPFINASVIYLVGNGTNRSIQGYCQGIDTDGDKLRYYYNYYINNRIRMYDVPEAFMAPNKSFIVTGLDSANFADEDIVILSCMVYDGIAQSPWVNSTPLGIPDITPPQIQVINPVSGVVYQRPYVTVAWNSSEPAVGCYYHIDGTARHDFNICNGGSAQNFTITGLVSGNHTLTIYANDSDTNTGTASVTFAIDLTMPDTDGDGIPDESDPDADNDGILDINDTVVGDANAVQTNRNNLSISIDESNLLGAPLNGSHQITFKEMGRPLVEFDFDFASQKLELNKIQLHTQDVDATRGKLIINGLNLGAENTKTVYLDKLGNSSAFVCIKDAQNVTEISEHCNATLEFAVRCDGTNFKNYSCTREGGRFKITGLHHSGIQEAPDVVITDNSTEVFAIKNSTKAKVVKFMNSGNLFIKGILEQNSNYPRKPSDLFIIRNNGSDVFVVDSSGNVHIDGTLTENQAVIAQNSPKDFIIKDNSGNKIAVITESGSLILKGWHYENESP